MALSVQDSRDINQRRISVSNDDDMELVIPVGPDGISTTYRGSACDVGRSFDTIVNRAKAAGNAFLGGITLIDANLACVIDANSTLCHQKQHNVEFVMSLSAAKECEREQAARSSSGGLGPTAPTSLWFGWRDA